MADARPPHDLELDEDIAVERRFWIAERVGWGLMALAVLAAGFGLLGHGPLSRAAAGDQDGPLYLEYQRFCRLGKPTELKVTMGPAAASGTEVAVTLSRVYLTRMQVERAMPEPHLVKGGEATLTYFFRLEDPARPATVLFRLEPTGMGRAEGEVAVPGSGALRFSQFIYP